MWLPAGRFDEVGDSCAGLALEEIDQQGLLRALADRRLRLFALQPGGGRLSLGASAALLIRTDFGSGRTARSSRLATADKMTSWVSGSLSMVASFGVRRRGNRGAPTTHSPAGRPVGAAGASTEQGGGPTHRVAPSNACFGREVQSVSANVSADSGDG